MLRTFRSRLLFAALPAVAAAATQLVALPPQMPANHRTLATLPDIPGPWYGAHPATPAASLDRRREALFSFVPQAGAAQTAANSRLTPLAADGAPKR
jgi:hypothetical protein